MRYFFGSNVKVLISVQTNLSVYGLACNGFIGGHARVFFNIQWMQKEAEAKTFILVLLSCQSQKGFSIAAEIMI